MSKIKITVCLGTSCHLKDSRIVINKFQDMISENQISEQVELTGSLCLNECRRGVCVKVNDVLYTADPKNAEDFFRNKVLPLIR